MTLKFDKKLVLNQWMLELFEVPDLERLADGLKRPELEGFDADNVSNFHHVLTGKSGLKDLKGNDGEVALRLGDNDPFGLISVGDASSLCKLCDEQDELVVTDQEFSGSLFLGLNKPESDINILMGSKKFTEGWSSWRVSTMGLMNIGKKKDLHNWKKPLNCQADSVEAFMNFTPTGRKKRRYTIKTKLTQQFSF